MPFTDEMLKEIKNGMSTLRMTMDVTEYSMNAEWLEALLARLDAAEALLPAWKQQNGQQETFDIWRKAEQAWLKSAGREGR